MYERQAIDTDRYAERLNNWFSSFFAGTDSSAASILFDGSSEELLDYVAALTGNQELTDADRWLEFTKELRRVMSRDLERRIENYEPE